MSSSPREAVLGAGFGSRVSDRSSWTAGKASGAGQLSSWPSRASACAAVDAAAYGASLLIAPIIARSAAPAPCRYAAPTTWTTTTASTALTQPTPLMTVTHDKPSPATHPPPPPRRRGRERWRRRSPTAQSLHSGAQEPQRLPDWEPRTAPHHRLLHETPKDNRPQCKRAKRGGKENPPQAPTQQGAEAQRGRRRTSSSVCEACPVGGGGHPTLLVHRPREVPRPCRVCFAPGTQPVGRAGEYSGCGVVWRHLEAGGECLGTGE